MLFCFENRSLFLGLASLWRCVGVWTLLLWFIRLWRWDVGVWIHCDVDIFRLVILQVWVSHHAGITHLCIGICGDKTWHCTEIRDNILLSFEAACTNNYYINNECMLRGAPLVNYYSELMLRCDHGYALTVLTLMTALLLKWIGRND